MLQVDMGIFGNFSKSPELQMLQGAMRIRLLHSLQLANSNAMVRQKFVI